MGEVSGLEQIGHLVGDAGHPLEGQEAEEGADNQHPDGGGDGKPAVEGRDLRLGAGKADQPAHTRGEAVQALGRAGAGQGQGVGQVDGQEGAGLHQLDGVDLVLVAGHVAHHRHGQQQRRGQEGDDAKRPKGQAPAPERRQARPPQQESSRRQALEDHGAVVEACEPRGRMQLDELEPQGLGHGQLGREPGQIDGGQQERPPP